VTGLVLAVVASSSWAARPDTDGEAWSFATTDVLSYVDSPTGAVRVHFSIEGPSVTVLDDLDGSGAPDLAEALAVTSEAALDRFIDLGFRPLIAEVDLGLDALGGSGAIDVYMVEFGGVGDGRFAIDGCSGGVCVGHLLTDNDFAESYYSDNEEAAAVLASHELFHGIQYAYATSLPSWMSEGMATWAERLFDPELSDYYGFCSAYLDEPTRSIDSPPAGVATAWSYGTALFFGYLEGRLGEEAGPAILDAMEGRDEGESVDVIIDVIDDFGDDIGDAWPLFAAWNLAVGRQSGGTGEGWPYADRLRAPPFEVEVEDGLLDDDNRFYPMAATYFRWVHAGGPASMAFADDPTGLVFSLHPFAGGADQGAVDAALLYLEPTSAGLSVLGDLPAGGYALVGSYPQQAAESNKVRFCLGAPGEVEACLEIEGDDGDDGTDGTDGTDTGGDDVDSGDAGDIDEPACGCATGGTTGLGLGLMAGLAVFSRRREQSPAA
jgi:MYXO-CTERM domain-containing protein